MTTTSSQPTYKVDFIRKSRNDPMIYAGHLPWLVIRIANGAWMAQCKTRESAERAMAKRIAKDAAKAGERA
jgi:hypothetical protein